MKALLSGNEAIARGAYEAGVVFASAYPGTPSTEILESLASYPEVEARWAPNEKVAVETAAGAALAGGRALAAMKHVGLNVAADPLFSLTYMGVGAGLVIVTADDPGMHSSQNEQDNRWYALAAKLPMLEPSDSQEALDFTRLAFELSERYNTPVLLRVTTRICHSMSVVLCGERTVPPTRPYKKNPAQRVLLPGHARAIHPRIEERLQQIQDDALCRNVTRLELRDPDVGIITSGVAYQYVREVFPQASCLKLGMTHPLPEAAVRDFARRVRRLYVIEELDPFLETRIRALGLAVVGKERLPRVGELEPSLLAECFEPAGKAAPHTPPGFQFAEVPARPPVFCPGCPHMPIFWALKKAHATVMGDIGCYTLGALPPLEAMDTCLNMGASIGMATGFAAVQPNAAKKKVVAVIGDSTFIHSGITSLIDLMYNQGVALVVILDNGTTAMTGHQDHPGTGRTLKGRETHRLDLFTLCKALGVSRVHEVDPYDVDSVLVLIKEELMRPEPAVLISRAPCVLRRKEPLGPPYWIDMDRCKLCALCLKLGCPAIERRGDTFLIEPLYCTGCGVCAEVCNLDAIHSRTEDLETVETQ